MLDRIQDWNVVRRRYFTDTCDLVLCNGFSMRYSRNFAYRSLFEVFIEECDPEVLELFEQYDTENFEEVMRYLLITHHTNELLGIEDDVTPDLICKFRTK